VAHTASRVQAEKAVKILLEWTCHKTPITLLTFSPLSSVRLIKACFYLFNQICILATAQCRNSIMGSWMIQAFCRTLNSLVDDVEFTEFLRRMSNAIIRESNFDYSQTPQISVYPHRRTYFCRFVSKYAIYLLTLIKINKYNTNARQSSVKQTRILSERLEYFPWHDERHVALKRGRALIFSQMENKEVEELDGALQVLGYQPLRSELSRTDEVLSKRNTNMLLILCNR